MRLLHTGQHYDPGLSAVFFEELGIPAPAWNLGCGGGTHGAMTGAMLAGIEQVLLEQRPDMVVTLGDTNSTSLARWRPPNCIFPSRMSKPASAVTTAGCPRN